MGTDEDEEREMVECEAGSGNEDDRLGLGFGGLWAIPQEEVLESDVLSEGGRGTREGDEDPGSRPRVSRCNGLRVEPDLEFDNEERGDERGDAKTRPLA